jgi:hypothetical protein
VEGLSRLREEIYQSTRHLRKIELKSDLELEIISALVNGERSVGELVELVFECKSSLLASSSIPSEERPKTINRNTRILLFKIPEIRKTKLKQT